MTAAEEAQHLSTTDWEGSQIVLLHQFRWKSDTLQLNLSINNISSLMIFVLHNIMSSRHIAIMTHPYPFKSYIYSWILVLFNDVSLSQFYQLYHEDWEHADWTLAKQTINVICNMLCEWVKTKVINNNDYAVEPETLIFPL